MNAKAPHKKSKILIVDDHPMVRERLAQVVNEQTDMATCGEAPNAAQTIAILEKLLPDLVLLDLNLKQSSGLELIKDIRNIRPKLPILVVSMHDESVFAERALHAGAQGYISKEEATVRVVAAIHEVLAGRVWLSKRMHARLLQRFVGNQQPEAGTEMEQLSDREIEIFEMIGRGMATRRIADALHIDPHTVETYRTRIKGKLGLEGSMELLQRAVQWVQSGEGSLPPKESVVRRLGVKIDG
jgi:DNA-binding NarL/FixJ family response regulator